MKNLFLAAMALLLAFAEDNAKIDPKKPTPLTTEQRLTLREAQLEISNLQLRHKDEMAPLLAKQQAEMEPIRQKINKLFRDLQVLHNCENCDLNAELTWEPRGGPAPPAAPAAAKPEAKKVEPAKKAVEQAKK